MNGGSPFKRDGIEIELGASDFIDVGPVKRDGIEIVPGSSDFNNGGSFKNPPCGLRQSYSDSSVEIFKVSGLI